MAYYDRATEGEKDNYGFEPEPLEGGERVPKEAPNVRFALVLKTLKQIHESLAYAIDLLSGESSAEPEKMMAELVTSKKELSRRLEDVSGSRVVEGVFDGAGMIGPDGKAYAIPPNYSSKSRLVEGDVMKLTIRADGSFVFKQIGPVERRRVVGTLAFDASTNSYVALSDGQTFKLLTASVTYFKGQPGDEVVLLLPKSGRAVWAAVENIIKK